MHKNVSGEAENPALISIGEGMSMAWICADICVGLCCTDFAVDVVDLCPNFNFPCGQCQVQLHP